MARNILPPANNTEIISENPLSNVKIDIKYIYIKCICYISSI